MSVAPLLSAVSLPLVVVLVLGRKRNSEGGLSVVEALQDGQGGQLGDERAEVGVEGEDAALDELHQGGGGDELGCRRESR